ncbi:YtxH domain-containing protein [Clostridium sp. Marseille-Q2269]|uniref:YtxH domain-containing protein n=1 Tax=Clostridium sp. Marseille-Q2269 TaxID=2942205 RepID=UPI0020733AC5|nr:YtxH domain-containing protein [Clostridium sp. Marseille-Q2269]
MSNRFLSGMTTGAIIGATVGMLMVPQLDRGTRRKIKRTSMTMMGMAGNMMGNMRGMMR